MSDNVFTENEAMKKLKKRGIAGFLLSEAKNAYYEFINNPTVKELSKIEKKSSDIFLSTLFLLRWGFPGLLAIVFLIKLIIRIFFKLQTGI